jgi:hypothetical protein
MSAYGMMLTPQMELSTDKTGKKKLSIMILDIMLPPGFPKHLRMPL